MPIQLASREEIEEMVLEVVSGQIGLPASALSISNHLMQDLGADSLDRIELIMTIEELFGTKFSDDIVSSLVKIEDVVDAIDKTALTSEHFKMARATWRMISNLPTTE